MSNTFWKKTFPLCTFSISKCLPTTTTTQAPSHLSDADADDRHVSHSSSYSSSSVVKNFNSLYNYVDLAAASSAGSTSKSAATDDFFSSSSDADDSDNSSPPDFADVFASQRFFFSSPGNSNSITDSKPTVSAAGISPPFDGVEVRKYSVDPYVDFRRSMQEMIDARNDDHDDKSTSDLEYLHELLLCFLSLNPRDTHKFIISAFSDIIVDMLSAPDRGRRHRELKHRRQRSRLRRLSM
ncbi:hypothetical protein L484_005418 [Morus notabilis]|uniref:Transcription repressor n=1 Tax=Morus notabilis TaxID=981085 RepID=W9RBF0_9ROSA|nr:transcription repressor OFP12 [Morus notabilis]EXB63455.1 hypothetical protein L484_005418 [Morus notabilis]